MQRYTINDFNRDYPDEDTCLERLRNRRYPNGSTCEKCERVTKYHRDAERRSYSCQWCGYHVHPTAGTIFEKSTTSLRLWFYAIFKMASTRCGISAKQLERELGVAYRTAWRMMNRIRNELMADNGEQLFGDVEIDETSWGGKPRGRKLNRREVAAFREAKPTILGMVERGGQ